MLKSEIQSMSNIIKPPRLKPGDTVGIASPAASFFSFTKNWLSRAMAAIEDLGLKVQIANNARHQREHLNPPPQLRVDDLHDLFADPDIKAIFCLSGGSGTNALLPLLDWDLIARSPKILMGYSANTALLLGIYARLNMVTFHGPTLLNGLSEYPKPLSYTLESIKDVLFTPIAPGPLEAPETWTDDMPREDSPRKMKNNSGWHWLKGGRAQGPLIGGNLHTLPILNGTPFWPSFHGKILYLEEVNMGNTVLMYAEEALAQCQQIGLFEKISGLITGKINNLSQDQEELLQSLIGYYTSAFDFPILTQVDIGHTSPQMILPNGITATLDSEQNLFSIDEAAVI